MSTLNANATGRKPGAGETIAKRPGICGPPSDELFPPASLGSLIPRRKYAALLGLHPKTCARHEREDSELPKPVYLRGRAYLPSEKLEEYRQKLIARGYTRTGTYPACPKAEG